MSTLRRLALSSFVTGLVVALDQLTKAAARVYLARRPPISLCGGVVRLVYSENVGAFLGLGAALRPTARVLIFGVFSGLLLIGVIVHLVTARGLARFDVIAASLLVAGGLGNLIDRALHDGRVTDFVSLGIGPLRTGIFNVADVAIVAGVGWLLAWSVAGGRESRQGRQ
ncbi:MAG: signal peptidase II [Chloroflexota bacterium]|nr:signal peptidase II [Chloroflexota bacterium]